MTATEERSFEQVYADLDATVQQLEAGGLPLEEAIALFERGMRLAQMCKTLLDGAELRVTTLAEQFRAIERAAGSDDDLED